MNRGIETAFWGTLGIDPELKTSKAGTAYTGMNVVVTVGATDEGKDVSQWLRVTCFSCRTRQEGLPVSWCAGRCSMW
jgi:Single-strand binding protein family